MGSGPKGVDDPCLNILGFSFTATLVACWRAGVVIDKVTGAYGQEQLAKNTNQSPMGNMWSAIPVALLRILVIVGDG